MLVNEFITQSNETGTLGDLVRSFCRVVGRFGYSAYCNISVDGIQTDSDEAIDEAGNTHYNKAFIEEYRTHNYLESDPVFKLFLRMHVPFTWEQVLRLPLNKKQLHIMNLRFAAGYKKGVSLPLKSADIKIVGMNLKSYSADTATDKDTLSQLYAIGNQFHLRRAGLLSPQQLALPEISLSPREQEMLLWCAQGKSNSVIAEILGISEKTVEFHMNSAFKKLNVNSRTTAVLKAMNLKLINV